MDIRWLAVCALLFSGSAVHAAEQGVKDISPGRLDLGVGELAVGVSQNSPQIQRVLIILHGRLRNAETYRQSAEKAAREAGQSATTLVIAPQFLNEADIARHDLHGVGQPFDPLHRLLQVIWLVAQPDQCHALLVTPLQAELPARQCMQGGTCQRRNDAIPPQRLAKTHPQHAPPLGRLHRHLRQCDCLPHR